ncbi:MAG TPA: hypothetical protein VHA52_00005, partial [Candidatus Babeliaceae bacterium]|nr:hypothetical protein [Candidatus Babeliaceae bacterium]
HPSFLSTLPNKEWFNGCVEILKAGLVADRELFENLETWPLEQVIQRAIEVKRRIVALDPTEKGLRRILNLGHTIGHALETLSNYQLSHGEAVAAGIVLEAHISYEMGILSEASYLQIANRFPPVSLAIDPEKMLQVLRVDKKSMQGCPRFVLLKEIGVPLESDGEYCREVPPEILEKVLHEALCPC